MVDEAGHDGGQALDPHVRRRVCPGNAAIASQSSARGSPGPGAPVTKATADASSRWVTGMPAYRPRPPRGRHSRHDQGRRPRPARAPRLPRGPPEHERVPALQPHDPACLSARSSTSRSLIASSPMPGSPGRLPTSISSLPAWHPRAGDGTRSRSWTIASARCDQLERPHGREAGMAGPGSDQMDDSAFAHQRRPYALRGSAQKLACACAEQPLREQRAGPRPDRPRPLPPLSVIHSLPSGSPT